MTIALDLLRVIELLNEAIYDNGPWHVATGRYIRSDDTVCCIGGEVLHRAGVPIETLKSWDKLPECSVASLARDGRLEQADISIDTDALNALNMAQAYQDTGSSWGLAVSHVIEHIDLTYTGDSDSDG